ncbi:MAG: hypothetical protein QNJ31_03255 [Candidatus Caenarcaniphilales bacterium]|nr:hypothetical protein [Candidatus Caenarcaniphilales bacterium]
MSKHTGSISIRDTIKTSLGLSIRNIKAVFCIALAMMFIPIILSFSFINNETSLKQALYYGLASFTWGILLSPGLFRSSLKLLEIERFSLRDLLPESWITFVRFVSAYFLIRLIVIIGYIFLFIPGLIFQVKLQYTLWLIKDKQYGVVRAMKKSWEMTRGLTLKLMLLNLIIGLLYIPIMLVAAIITIVLIILSKIINADPSLAKILVIDLFLGYFLVFTLLSIGLTYKKIQLTKSEVSAIEV